MIRLPLLGLIVIALACVDPHNLPFSNQAAQGVQNNRVELPSRDLQGKVEHVRWSPRHADPQRASGQGRRELWPGVASGVDILATPRPDYRSSYVFVNGAQQLQTGLALDDRRLRSLTIGLQMAGSDAMNSPAAVAIARRGLARNVQGYPHYANVDWSNPPVGNVSALVSARAMARSTGGM
jgi:mxaJ protein